MSKIQKILTSVKPRESPPAPGFQFWQSPLRKNDDQASGTARNMINAIDIHIRTCLIPAVVFCMDLCNGSGHCDDFDCENQSCLAFF